MPRLINLSAIVVFLIATPCINAALLDYNDISAYYGFGEMETIKLDWGVRNLRIKDFNGDSRNDIAIVNNRKAKIELLIQKDSVRASHERRATIFVDPEDIDVNAIFDNLPTRFHRQSIAVSQSVFSFVCGDLNSDGMTDLAFYGEPKGLYVILQKASDETQATSHDCSWRTKKKIKIDDGLLTPNALVCADLNNDSADDLILAGQDAVYVILQKKDGTLAEPIKYPTTVKTLALDAADLNGDNINDLILVTDDEEKRIHVRFGLETGQLGPQVRLFIERPFALELSNINQTNGDEILAVNAMNGRLACYEFTAQNEEDADWPILFYPLASGQASTDRDLVTGDFDGDGLVDLVISDPGAAEIILYRQKAKLGLVEPMRFPAFADITRLSAMDIDHDGKTELGVLSIKEKVIGISEFEDDRLSFPQPLEIIGEPVAMELADVDHDGGIDCLYISKDANDNRAMRVIYTVAAAGNQAANLTKKQKKQLKNSGPVGEIGPALELNKLAANPDGLKILDVDQDGLEDILVFEKYNPPPILVRQTQKRQFEIIDSPKAQASLIKDATLSSIAVADVDAKAGKELLVAQTNFARSLIFADSQNWTIIDQYNARGKENQVSAVAAFHLDDKGSDQPAILLLDGQKGQLQLLKADIDKTYRFEKELDVGKWNTAATHLKMVFAPLTGDSVNSILLFDSEKFAIVTPADTGNLPQHLEQKFGYETKIKDGAYGNLITGDINSDGRIDIIMVEYKNNHIEILALDADMKPTPAMRFKLFERKSYTDKKEKARIEPRELKIADVTGDGKNDLITVIHDRIIIYPQD